MAAIKHSSGFLFSQYSLKIKWRFAGMLYQNCLQPSPAGVTLQRKKEIFINPITRKEAKILRLNNMEMYVICGHGTYKNYFIVEKPSVLKILENYRKSIIIFSLGGDKV